MNAITSPEIHTLTAVQIREQMQAQSVDAPDLQPMAEGEIIEGEVIRVVDEGKRLGE